MFIEYGRQVIEEEAEGLRILSENMPSSFLDAINAIYECDGRLIVTGIGKSGHIGRKISSTMSSTGQKSFFIHPSEAHHGDLGMIDSNDVLLLISCSGEARELFPVIEYAKRIGVKTISITKNIKSNLAQNTDIVLYLPDIPEGCSSIGCLPTVSSTMTLALGDAIAVSLLSMRGFTNEQFKALHPGGAIGYRLTTVHEVMHKNDEIPLVNNGSLMKNTIIIMSEKGLGCVGVIDQHSSKMMGIITDGDLRRHMSDHILSKNVEDVMTKNPVCIRNNMLLSEVLHIMENRKITCVFVLNEDEIPIGCVHIHDILQRKWA
ncbi:MAG: KpsF/GutQ family sugar-phosphate isomerase [Holosporales bacterium]|jgi:arabinose-5-phosphate isomerase|nr:KpsF/GutQ family sugar-phosphate isomerase [Holosporales bacterium]